MFNTLINLFNPGNRKEKENHKQNTDKTTVHPDNIVDFQNELIDAVVACFKPYYKKNSFTDTIIIWVTSEQSLYQTIVREKDFEDALRTALDNANLKAVGAADIRFKTENLPNGAVFSQIKDGIYIETKPTVEKQRTETHTKAKIVIWENKGSLTQPEIILNPTERLTVFHIGRSETVNDNKGYRNNHIAIRDNDEAQNENNSCVSRAHADIIYKNNSFYLQALPGGCRPAGGSSTKIIRNEQTPEELRDTGTLRHLQNGDIIELGKKVRLKFEII